MDFPQQWLAALKLKRKKRSAAFVKFLRAEEDKEYANAVAQAEENIRDKAEQIRLANFESNKRLRLQRETQLRHNKRLLAMTIRRFYNPRCQFPSEPYSLALDDPGHYKEIAEFRKSKTWKNWLKKNIS